MKWNPRWLNYARVHGVSPSEVTSFEFITWNNARINEWCTLNRVKRSNGLSNEQLAEYDAWLDVYVPNTDKMSAMETENE